MKELELCSLATAGSGREGALNARAGTSDSWTPANWPLPTSCHRLLPASRLAAALPADVLPLLVACQQIGRLPATWPPSAAARRIGLPHGSHSRLQHVCPVRPVGAALVGAWQTGRAAGQRVGSQAVGRVREQQALNARARTVPHQAPRTCTRTHTAPRHGMRTCGSTPPRLPDSAHAQHRRHTRLWARPHLAVHNVGRPDGPVGAQLGSAAIDEGAIAGGHACGPGKWPASFCDRGREYAQHKAPGRQAGGTRAAASTAWRC